MTEKIVLVTGGFDPLHSGHIEYFKEAKKLGNKLIVGINSDAWLTRKKGRSFMSWKERAAIVTNLAMVDDVVEFNDDDNTALNAIEITQEKYPNSELIFANGGDRTVQNIPEMSAKNVIFKFGVGGENKANSSSWILDEWKAPKTIRPWGYYRVLHEVGMHTKLKELTVEPGKHLSMQRHTQRSELWVVAEGTATVYTLCERTTDIDCIGIYEKHSYLHISCNEWHQLSNETDQPLKIIEIQYGDACVEEDIQRSISIS